jgi:hypothetical protein
MSGLKTIYRNLIANKTTIEIMDTAVVNRADDIDKNSSGVWSLLLESILDLAVRLSAGKPSQEDGSWEELQP